jgi:cyclophilin family peptidyl-prolyl cis-trans isomerase
LKSLCAFILCLFGFFTASLLAVDEPYVLNLIPSATLEKGGKTLFYDLSSTFALKNASGPIVEMTLNVEKLYIILASDITPQAVANFRRYMNAGLYNSTIIHRSEKNNLGAPFIIQGGGFQLAEGLPHIPTYSPIPNEFAISNFAGTIAMGLVADNPNSATSEWFFNLSNNAFLDDPGRRYTVFGRLIGFGLNTAWAINDLRTQDLSAIYSSLAFSSVPYYTKNAEDFFIVLDKVAEVPLLKLPATSPGYLTLSVSSSDPNIVTPEIISSGLMLISGNAIGTATITMQAIDYYGQAVTTTFTVTSFDPNPPPPPAPLTYKLTLKASPAGYGTVRGAASYLPTTKITIKAIPRPRRKFVKWTLNGKRISKSPTVSFFLASDATLVAVFSK